MTDPERTTSRLVPARELAGDDIGAMHALLSRHFLGVSAERFRADLAEKNFALLIHRAGRLVGFTTILAYESHFDGGPVSVIYSGDTIVAPEAWNAATLPRAWLESIAAVRRHVPRGPYVWLLIASGFRTYRFLPLFQRTFYPRCDGPTPMDWRRLLEHLAAERFGGRYDRGQGIVRLEHPQRLNDELAEIPPGRLSDAHIAFFARRNPGYVQGDELVCISELSRGNLTAAGRRMATGLGEW
jgi:hypothetical protein